VLIPKILDKLKVASSRDPSGVVAPRVLQPCSAFYRTTIEYHGFVHFARLVILAAGVPTWKLAWNFSAQQVAGIGEDHGNNDYSSNQ
jgi:hypothetical protein